LEQQIQQVSYRGIVYAVSPFLTPIFRGIGFRCQVSGVGWVQVLDYENAKLQVKVVALPYEQLMDS
jgi:hypothetical protein